MVRRILLTFAFLLGNTAALEWQGRTLSTESVVVIFPRNWGELTEPIRFEGHSYVGVGVAVFVIDDKKGVIGRIDLPGLISGLDSDNNAVYATIQGTGYTERFTLSDFKVSERAVIAPISDISLWLAHTTRDLSSAELQTAAADFPDNPFLQLKTQPLSLSFINRILNRSSLTFPAWTALAQQFDALGFPAAASTALEHAKQDASARGIDPALPVNRHTLEAYGNPSGYIGVLLEQNKLERADVWMRFLRELYPRFEGYEALYARYAQILETQGRIGEAEEWRQLSSSLRRGSLYNLGESDTALLRLGSIYAAIVFSLALAAAWMMLMIRAWMGRHDKSLNTLLAQSYLSERGTLLALGLGILVALGNWHWSNEAQSKLSADAFNMGTYGGGWYAAQLDHSYFVAGKGGLLRGIAAQLDHDDSTARLAYATIDHACAYNNLGTLASQNGDQHQAIGYYRRALELQPDLNSARFNLGLNAHTPTAQYQSAFQKIYRRQEPQLCYPDRKTLLRMLDLNLIPSWQHWQALDSARLGALVLLLFLGIHLFIPKRPPVIQAPIWIHFLFPGSYFLRLAWGSVLLVVWAGAIVTLSPTFVSEFQLMGIIWQPYLGKLQAVAWVFLMGSYILNTILLYMHHDRKHKSDLSLP